MPKKDPKPKWDFKTRYLLGNDGEKVFSAKDINHLANMLEGVDDLVEFKDHLESTGNIYRIHKQNFENVPTHAQSKAALKVVKKQAENLRDTLHKLDDKSWGIIFKPEMKATYELMEKDMVVTDMGRVITKTKYSDGSYSYGNSGVSLEIILRFRFWSAFFRK